MSSRVTSRVVLSSLLLLLSVLPHLHSTPILSSGSHSAAANNLETLRGIIMELENVLYKLKDYARELQASGGSSRGRDSFLGDLADDLDLNDLQLAASSAKSQPVVGSRPRPPLQQGSDLSGNDDLSLKEAVEYLVGLAKQKKMERRDHDIPFPLVDREGK